MQVADVAPALQQQLGPEAAEGMLALFETARVEWMADVIATTSERFERRLTDELGLVRSEISALGASLREEMKAGLTSMREEMRDLRASLREEIREGDSGLRLEMHDIAATLREEIRNSDARRGKEMASLKFDLLKWCFGFWVGQAIATVGIVGVMFQLMRA